MCRRLLVNAPVGKGNQLRDGGSLFPLLKGNAVLIDDGVSALPGVVGLRLLPQPVEKQGKFVPRNRDPGRSSGADSKNPGSGDSPGYARTAG